MAWRYCYQADACGEDTLNQWIESLFTQPHPSALWLVTEVCYQHYAKQHHEYA